MFQQLGLIGCGLMGGSFALALKKAGWVQHVVGYSKSPSTTAHALQMGVIDATAASAAEAAAGSDLVLLALPVGATEATLQAILPTITPRTLIMDVGSTKGDVVQAARRALGPLLANFVPAHPNTGKEVAGVAHADAHLYRGAKVILTPTELTLPSHLHNAEALWRALECEVHVMPPATHDAAFAAVSHLPHMLAFAMMQSLSHQAQCDAFLQIAGPGFRDFTRIAAGEPTMWRDILLANQTEVLAQAQHFRQALQAFEEALRAGDAQALEAMIAAASSARARCRFSPAPHATPAATAAAA